MVVCNSGNVELAAVFNASRGEYDRMLDNNLRAAMHLARLVTPYLCHRTSEEDNSSRALIFLSSIVALAHTLPGFGAYIAAQAGLRGISIWVLFACFSDPSLPAFASSIFQDVCRFDVKVSCICPGLVNTSTSPFNGETMGEYYREDITNKDLIQVWWIFAIVGF